MYNHFAYTLVFAIVASLGFVVWALVTLNFPAGNCLTVSGSVCACVCGCGCGCLWECVYVSVWVSVCVWVGGSVGMGVYKHVDGRERERKGGWERE